jgi:hypothetical protein
MNVRAESQQHVAVVNAEAGAVARWSGGFKNLPSALKRECTSVYFL